MSSLLEDTIKKALLLNENEVLRLNCKTSKNLSTTRLALYRTKNKIDLEDEIKISMDSKSLTIQLSKKKKEELFSIEIISGGKEEDFKEEENPSDKIQTINIDPEKIKTIRQALSKYDSEKSEIVRGFSEEKIKVLEDTSLSEQEKEEKIKDLLQTANIKIENFNKLAKEESLRFSK